MNDTYTVQVHGEWSGIPEYDWMDIDYEVKTLEEVYKIIEDEIPKGVPYIVYDPWDNFLMEGEK